MQRIYLDNNASTPLDLAVQKAMIEEMQQTPANPSSVHYFGQEARNRLSLARRKIAALLSVKPSELLFTSGGTESINLALKGICAKLSKGHIISSKGEHKAVLNTLAYLEKQGWRVSYLDPRCGGVPSLEDIEKAFCEDTRLLALMAVNNETGAKLPIKEVGELAKKHEALFFSDGVAAIGKEKFSVPDTVSAMAFSAHKFHGPKGTGLLVLRPSLRMEAQVLGGGQEYQKRAGTENLVGIIGLEKALSICAEKQAEITKHLLELRDYFEDRVQKEIGDVQINGGDQRSPNTSNISFLGVEGESLLMNLDLAGVAVSHGSACTSGALEPSHVLLAMGLTTDMASSALRFSFSRMNTKDEVDKVLDILKKSVEKLRKFVM